MCDFGLPPSSFRIVSYVPTSSGWETLRSNEIFHNVPYQGPVLWDKVRDITEEGVYFVTCTGAHYVYYNSEFQRTYHIERVECDVH